MIVFEDVERSVEPGHYNSKISVLRLFRFEGFGRMVEGGIWKTCSVLYRLLPSTGGAGTPYSLYTIYYSLLLLLLKRKVVKIIK